MDATCSTHINCVADVHSREIIYMFLFGQLPGLVENFNIGNFSDTINVTNVKLCMMLLHIELYLSITLSVSLTILQGHISVRRFSLKILCSYVIKWKLCRDCLVHQASDEYTTILFLVIKQIYSRETIDMFPENFTVGFFSRTLFEQCISNFALLYPCLGSSNIYQV